LEVVLKAIDLAKEKKVKKRIYKPLFATAEELWTA